MAFFTLVVLVCSGICSIFAAIMLIVKPIRDRLFGTKEIREGQKCLLRADMLNIYYKNSDVGKIRQYEKENFIFEYKAYKALGGNSFIDDIFDRVRNWDVIT